MMGMYPAMAGIAVTVEIIHPEDFAARARCAGFTMIELVVVMVIVAALAFVAIPRLDQSSMKIAPVAEQIAAEIRYAQSLALTRGEPHTFTVGGGGFSISSGGSAVSLSNGDASGSYTDVVVDSASVTFSSRFGQPDAGAVISVSGGSSSVSVIVEGETGYVRVQQ